MLGFKLGLMTLLTIGSFVYLMHWLDRPQGTQGGEATAEAKTSDPYGGVQQPRQPDTAKPPAANEDDGANVAPASERAAHVNMAFVGDIMFAGKVKELLTQHGYEYPFKYVHSYLEKADITVANLETPITTRGTAEEKTYAYRSSPLALPELKKAGVDLVNLANNHSMDYGVQGLLDTLDHLDMEGIQRVGAGRNAEEAYRHVTMDHNGMKIAFLGFSRVIHSTSWYAGNSRPGLAETYTTKLPLEAIKKAREEADLVVVIAHWGEERNNRPIKVQTDLARQYIDQGADLVVASHPHVLQGFEQYKGKWIAYSLGNFIFTTNENPATWESLILEASCSKERGCDLQLVPILTKWAQPIRMVEEDGRKLFEKLTNISVNAHVDAKGRITVAPGPPKVPVPVADQKPAVKSPVNEVKKPTDSNKDVGSGTAGETGKKTDNDTSKPGEASKPGSTTKPSETSKSNGTSKPDETTKPGESTQSGSSAKPERTTAPEEQNHPDSQQR
ncbi:MULTISPECIES: CapA family protein [unclassified Paenibacillus]|uniref:CapA family protein n=1 Tax=unclassified Paenibacillus TaxID=185978 RepID=UPI001AE3AECC|nr:MULTISPECIES: CapA family protein [unclassified Paenibacillus]MBP1154732.1 poly-gamma-glutamate synthesis protein (capsule biosynthesis protein) [Paenibacillus sp. PvP091]MBP1169884.1 poly-gamma-glutamate synthesis protein (capsule biosynthesis protein) [Paenibacillus sp. PvR098]MBP2440912.1 poly-gamma-glutamate synthesis protein (capsule biosynthesis protein) [Paenibacillus sp. PvP052]